MQSVFLAGFKQVNRDSLIYIELGLDQIKAGVLGYPRFLETSQVVFFLTFSNFQRALLILVEQEQERHSKKLSTLSWTLQHYDGV